jgi:hypothetical protein
MKVIVEGRNHEFDGLISNYYGCPDWEGCPHNDDNCWEEDT